ncbi:MAG TPA: DUF4845 domain-containing protein [Gammaproteobacteria bacterium]|nr:DUF4845 domain-containing protein [Gammaproteobacteria bacterium]
MKNNKLNFKKRQSGFGVFGLLVGAFLTMFFAMMAVSLLPPYLENFSVRSSISSLLSDNNILNENEKKIKKALLKKLSVSNVKSVSEDNISIQKEKEKVKIKVDYMVQAKFIKNVDFLIHFDESDEATL